MNPNSIKLELDRFISEVISMFNCATFDCALLKLIWNWCFKGLVEFAKTAVVVLLNFAVSPDIPKGHFVELALSVKFNWLYAELHVTREIKALRIYPLFPICFAERMKNTQDWYENILKNRSHHNFEN